MVVQNAEADHRAYIHPIASPDGLSVVTEDSPSHHVWQHGLYIGLNDVNGVGFWTEGRAKSGADTDGTFHPRIVGTPQARGARADWTISSDYRKPDGEGILDETQDWTFTDLGNRFLLDLSWTLRARDPVRFGEYPYGGLFLRMPFRPDSGGAAFNSRGETPPEADGHRAQWVTVRMPIDGREGDVQVAILDHPSNPEHPVPWRIDNQLGVSPSVSVAGEWRLGAGEERLFRYRVIVYNAPVESSVIDESWASLSEEP
jgi:hypothetical protein